MRIDRSSAAVDGDPADAGILEHVRMPSLVNGLELDEYAKSGLFTSLRCHATIASHPWSWS